MKLGNLVKVLAALACAGAVSAHADLLDDIKSRGKLNCGIYVGFEPFGFSDPKTHEVVGYEPDLCRTLAASLKVQPVLTEVSPASRIPTLLQGRVDVLVSLPSYSKARAEQVDFSRSYLTDRFRFMVRADSGLNEMLDLSEKRIATIKGSFLEPMLRQALPKATIVSFDDGPTGYIALQQGKVNAVCIRASVLRGLQIRSEAEPGTVKTRIIEKPFTSERSGFAIKKGEPQMLEYLNNFLLELERSGDAAKLHAKWLGSESPYKFPRDFKVGEVMSE